MVKFIKPTLFTVFIIALIAILIMPMARMGFGNDYVNPLLKTKESQQISTVAENIVAMVQRGDSVGLSKYSSRYLDEVDISNLVIGAKTYLPLQPPAKVQLVGLQKGDTYKDGVRFNFVQAVLEYQFGQAWYTATVDYASQGDNLQLLGLHFLRLPSSLETLNKVDLTNSSFLQYFVLILAIVIPLTILTVLIICVRRSNLKNKWLWIIFIIFGVFGFHFNWTTQILSITPINFQLLGAGYFRAGRYASLILSFSIPLGAIVFLLKLVIDKKYCRVCAAN